MMQGRKAVILARGLGKRMRAGSPGASLDAAQAAAADAGMKGMMPVGRPFLDYVLDSLGTVGVNHVCIVLGPEHHAARERYSRVAPPGVEVEFAIQAEPLGTADAVLAAESFAGDQLFIVVNSDNYYPASALRRLVDIGVPAILAFDVKALVARGNVPPDRVFRFGAVEADAHGNLARIRIRGPDEAAQDGGPVYASMNCWQFDPLIFEACRRVRPSARGELELPQAVQLGIGELGLALRVIYTSDAVLDLSSRADVESVTRMLRDVPVSLVGEERSAQG